MSIAVPAIPTPYIHSSIKRRKNTWYTQKDGNWSDSSVWESNASKRWGYPGQNIPLPVFPQIGDDVYINNNITLDINSGNPTVNNLRISGKLTFNSSTTITVNGDIQATGAVDMTASNSNLILYGVNNFITTFTYGLGIVTYTRIGDQPLMPLTYYKLYVTGTGTKTAQSDVSILGTLIVTTTSTLYPNVSIFEMGSYNLSVTGTTSVVAGSSLSKSGSGTVLFIGSFNVQNNTSTASFAGNPTIEFRGGITDNASIALVNYGTGNISFTTNSQNVNFSYGGAAMANQILIVGAITVTNTVGSGAGYWEIDNYIDGTASGSALVNKGILYIGSTTLPMATFGTWDYTTYSTNTVGFVMNSSYAIPYTAFTGSLLVSGTGIKTLSGNTTVGGNLLISATKAASTFDSGSNNLSVTGTTSITGSTFNATGAGSLLFVGLFSGSIINFSGNPTVELRGGISPLGITVGSTGTGTGTWSFTTNNQTITSSNVFNCNIIISGAITVTFNVSVTAIFTGTINGDNASSILDNRGFLVYQSATAPMATGKLYCNQATNTFYYNLLGGQDIRVPSDPTPGYNNLTIGGSGAKKLLGNVSVKGTYTVNGTATLNSNGYSLTNP